MAIVLQGNGGGTPRPYSINSQDFAGESTAARVPGRRQLRSARLRVVDDIMGAIRGIAPGTRCVGRVFHAPAFPGDKG